MISCKQENRSSLKSEQSQAIKDSLTIEIEKLSKGYFNGLGVAVVDSSGVIYAKGIGFADMEKKKPYTSHTIQPIASVSKTLIGIALLKAQEKGLLNLDDPISNHLPFQVNNPSHPDDPITIRHLATHTSSIMDTEDYMNRSYILEGNSDGVSIEDIPQSFNPNEDKISLSEFLENYLTAQGHWYDKDAFSANKPGEMFEYTNVGSTLAAHIIEQVSNQTYADFTIEHILRPLNMTHSSWTYDSVEFENVSKLYSNPETKVPYYSLITYPDGGLLTTVSDLSKYLNELIKGYSGSGTLLSQRSYRELFKKQLTAEQFSDRNPNHPYKDDYDIGIFIGFSAMDNIGHTGGDPGVSSMMFFNAKDKVGRILLVNTNIENQNGVNAYYKIYDKLGEYASKLN
ncbi:serine hydrolase [Aureibacter tunicatorum]|nr:serine hydrolase [Aureibacter tunicatorum]